MFVLIVLRAAGGFPLGLLGLWVDLFAIMQGFLLDFWVPFTWVEFGLHLGFSVCLWWGWVFV